MTDFYLIIAGVLITFLWTWLDAKGVKQIAAKFGKKIDYRPHKMPAVFIRWVLYCIVAFSLVGLTVPEHQILYAHAVLLLTRGSLFDLFFNVHSGNSWNYTKQDDTIKIFGIDVDYIDHPAFPFLSLMLLIVILVL